jgi:Domain of unknown function (DUF4145)
MSTSIYCPHCHKHTDLRQAQHIVSKYTSGLQKEIKERATVVRWIGNDAAHSDKQAVTREDAKDCLDLAEQFLHVIFVAPAIANARKAERGK